MSLSVKTQGGSGGGLSASIFVKGLSESDVVTATKRVPLLPEGYTQLSYIESSGTQYINTGVSITQDHGVEFDGYVSGADQSFFGVNSKTTNGTPYISMNDESGNIRLRWNTTQYTLGSAYSARSRINLKVNKGTWYIDGTQVYQFAQGSFSIDEDLYLFGRHEGSSVVSWAMTGRCYSAKVYMNDEAIRDFVPAKRDTDGTIGLYDIVTSAFYTNSGTGSFIAGAENIEYIEYPTPKVPDGYTELEYIESTGEQYIDTGVIRNSAKYRRYTEFQFTNISASYQNIAGAAVPTTANDLLQLGAGGLKTQWVNRSSKVLLATIDTSTHTLDQIWDNGTGTVIFDGVSSTQSYSNVEQTVSEYLFAYHASSGVEANSSFHGKISRHTLWKDDVKVCDLIPARRNSDSAIGMYDTVSGEFFENAGTGKFYAGAEVHYPADPYLKVGEWTERANPESVVPEGYTQLSYIESTGTQYIDTGFTPTTQSKVKVSFQATSVPSSGYSWIMSISLGANFRAGFVNGAFWISNGFSYSQTSVVTAKTIADGTCPADTSGSLYMFAQNDGGGNLSDIENSKYKLYYCKIWDANETLVRDFIPAKRNSDGVVGLYDAANDVFYTNAGSGSFLAGEEVPASFGGHLISRIKDLGMWTVTATNGEKTATQDVLVDVATEYEILMDLYKLWLYREGDECEEVTGGWKFTTSATSIGSYVTEKREDSIYVKATATSASTIAANTGLVQSIDLAPYTKIYFDVAMGHTDTAVWDYINLYTDGYKNTIAVYSLAGNTTIGRTVIEYDISAINELRFPELAALTKGSGKYGEITLYNCWLE